MCTSSAPLRRCRAQGTDQLPGLSSHASFCTKPELIRHFFPSRAHLHPAQRLPPRHSSASYCMARERGSPFGISWFFPFPKYGGRWKRYIVLRCVFICNGMEIDVVWGLVQQCWGSPRGAQGAHTSKRRQRSLIKLAHRTSLRSQGAEGLQPPHTHTHNSPQRQIPLQTTKKLPRADSLGVPPLRSSDQAPRSPQERLIRVKDGCGAGSEETCHSFQCASQ